MMTPDRLVWLLSLVALGLVACGAPEGSDDGPLTVGDVGGGGGAPDAGEMNDAGTMPDGGESETDAGTSISPLAVLGGEAEGLEGVEVETVVDSEAGLAGPRDVEFNPRAPDQLWIVNRGDHSAVVVTEIGTDSQSAEKFNGPNSRHFMAKPAALAFGKEGFMATAQQENEQTQPDTPTDFMGTSLWTTDLDEFDAGHASHYDMLHNSPLASGIAWDEGHAYWVFDGSHGSITRYDFNEHHGAGGTDHSDGIVRRYINGELAVEEGVVAHVAFDRESGLVYAADTGHSRIIALDTETGEVGRAIQPDYDGSDQRFVDGAEYETVVEGDGRVWELSKPAGLELHEDYLFVSENSNSLVHAFTKDGELEGTLDLGDEIPEGGLDGIAFDEEGNLYVVNSADDEILRVTPAGE